MKNILYTRQTVTSLIASLALSYFLFKTKDVLSKIIISLFLIFALALLVTNILLILNKKSQAKKVSKVYVIAFLIYWFGFLIYWDYVSIINKNYIGLIASVLFWFGGGYVAYKRFRKNK